MPENYEDRLTELFPDRFAKLRLFIPDPYDLILSKLCRNIERDREDVKFLVTTRLLDADVLRERYKELLANLIVQAARRYAGILGGSLFSWSRSAGAYHSIP